MRKIYYTILIFCLLFLTSLSWAEETIKIASIFAETGNAAVGSTPTISGIKFAVEELNHSGGLLGKKIKLLEFDNSSSALGSKIAAQKAVKAGVKVVFGANWSSHSLAMAPVLQAAKIPMISPYSTNPDVTLVGDYIFRVCFIDSFQGKVMANFAFQDLKAGTSAMLVNASSKYSETLSRIFSQRFKKLGGKILFEEIYLQDTDNFHSYLKKIKLLQPSVLFVPGHIIDSARIIKQARDIGIKVPILGGDGWSNSMYELAGSALNGNYYSVHWHKDSRNTKNRLFVRKYQKEVGKIERNGPALAYDTVSLYADAVHRAGSFNPSKVREALAATKSFKGVTGDITFNKNGDPIKPAVILRFENGTSVYVKTINPQGD